MIPKMMKAIVIETAGAKPVFKEIPVPIPNSGQVLVKVDSAPINPSDLAFLHGSYSSGKKFPCVPGFEGAGTVVSSGGGIMGWKVNGKRVAFYTQSDYGTYAEYSVADAISCLELDDNQQMVDSCCAFVNPVTVMAMLELVRNSKVNAVVHTAAASSLGKMMVRHFHQNGVRVINIVRRDAQIEVLQKEGADIVLNSSDAEFIPKLKDITAKLGATIFFDAIGGEITGQILEAMPNDSIAYVYGGLALTSVSGITIMDLIFKNKKVQGFWLTQYLGQKNLLSQALFIKNLKNLLRTTLKSHIAKTYKIEDFQEAVEFYIKNMTDGKVLIRPQGE